jgi:hypothetical protein
VWIQRFNLALCAPLGRLLGYRPSYGSEDERAEGEVVPA